MGAVRPIPCSLSSFANYGLQYSISRLKISVFRHGFSSSRPNFQASLLSGSVSKDTVSIQQSEIIFLGTGTSEGIPRVSCLTDPIKTCPVCTKAIEPGNKNRRRNTSILICYPGSSGRRNVLIDAGKFFYHSALKWFPTYGIRALDAVIITHSHADAIGGLDDLRDWTNNVQPYIPIYVAMRDFEVMKKTHYYLVDTSVIIPGAAVSELQFNIIEEEPFIVHDLKFTPLPVWHGHGYRSLGFRFGNICYISDVSEIPDETYPLLKDCELLVLDALRPDRSSSTHFGLPRALDEVRKIGPKKTLFTARDYFGQSFLNAQNVLENMQVFMTFPSPPFRDHQYNPGYFSVCRACSGRYGSSDKPNNSVRFEIALVTLHWVESEKTSRAQVFNE